MPDVSAAKEKTEEQAFGLIDGILSEDPDASNDRIVFLCRQDERFSYSEEKWQEMIRNYRQEYSRVTESIGRSLEQLCTS